MPSLSDLLQGELRRALPLFEPRPSQLAMAEQVERALTQGRALVVEAGTGTGKTLAYLLPAARSGLKVVVSTATKTLQEQLADKDVPLVQALGVKARFAFLKGRQNYLCLLRKEHFDRQPTFAAREEAGMYGQLHAWAEETRTGDRAELAGLPESFATWREVNSTAETCTGQKCPYYDRCFVFSMRRQAAEADVIIVNHHLFFADLALRSSSAGDAGAAVLPRYDAVIFDEAHATPEVAIENFGAQLSSFRFTELARDVLRVPATPPHARDLAGRLLREGSSFFEAAARCRPAGGKFSRDSDRWSLPPGSLLPAEREREALTELLRALSAALSGSGSDEVQLLERRCLALSADLLLFAGSQAVSGRGDVEYDEPRPPDRLVQWAEQRSGHLFLNASPIDVAGIFQDHLYDRVGPVVFTSATLAAFGSLDYFARRVGLRDSGGPLFPLDEAVLLSPFDYQANAAIYLPERMPDPQDERFADAVADELRQLLPITGGRAFALFTSLRNMRRVYELLAPELPWPALLQGERPKAQLLKAFKDKPSVLFASQSFWEGVDVQGDALSLVVIDKLPFASPGEPLVQARIEQLRAAGEDPFYAFQLPEAALALKQGFGRLIRSARDRGIVALLDPRIAGRGYGRRFLQSLPPCRVVRSPDEARGFWNGLPKR
ncbi:MAG TPA: ATP-dependent DNA helicase [Myxococcales bacterium]|nr:ATP-dependent DNA helicase [Myxococcales bacterium]